MKRFNSFHSLNVFTLELDKWIYEKHTHNFYELILIESGSGVHRVNDASFEYTRGDVFLLTPQDAHEFEIHEKTVFLYIKFTERIFLERFSEKNNIHTDTVIRQSVLQLRTHQGSSIIHKDNVPNVFFIARMMKQEFEGDALYNREVLLKLFDALMILLVRDLGLGTQTTRNGREKEKLYAILSYIRLHLLEPDKNKIATIAQQFNMSRHYISSYIKKHTGLSIQQHIIQTRIKYAEKLLKQKRLNINEIAAQLGFSDASHFNKTIKKYRKATPKALAQALK